MNYNVIQNAITKGAQVEHPDGVMTIVGEYGNNLDGAIIGWHNQCAALRNDADTLCYTCEIIDSQLDKVGDFKEFVDKRQNPTPTPEPNQG